MLKREKTLKTAIVVGGGIIGLASAFELQARGLATVLVDPERERRHASWGNAGHLAVEQVEPLASVAALKSFPRRLFSRGGALALPAADIGAWLPFACRLIAASRPRRFAAGKVALKSLVGRALPAWRELAARADAQSLIAEDGHFVVWESAAGARAGRASWSNADIGSASVRDLTGEEREQIAGLLVRPPVDGLRFSGSGRVLDPGSLNNRLAAAFAAAGGETLESRVQRVAIGKGQAVLRLGDGARLSADVIVIAAGVGSGALLRQVGYRVPIIAERGYHIQADSAAWPDMPPVVFEDRSMIVSRFRSGLRVASFVEFARESSPPDPLKWQRLHAHAAELGLPFDSAPHEWMGARPTLPDYLPAIGRCARASNLLYAFGHQHLGLTLAAITADIVAALASGQDPPLDLRAFAIERFR
ncbi:MAG: FAD-binding oxidoreductase [Steroidobacteraceae bacterium]|nr:FAD-binding oxidoreductase [Steroidobacteraceae bacterium]